MKIAIIGANGKVGSLVVEQSVAKGYDTTAIMRSSKETPAQHTLIKDVFELTREDLSSFDIVVSALAFWQADTLIHHKTALEHLSAVLKNSATHLVVVGGAGSMYINETRSLQLKDTESFPPEFKPLASAMSEGLDALRKTSNVNWVYVSPAIDFDVDIPASNKVLIGGEVLMDVSPNQISYKDYAVALVNLFESINKYNQQRISLVGKQ